MKDKAWFTEEVIYQDGLVTVKLNGKTVNEYKIPQADVEHEIANKKTWLPRGTFALQAHPPAPGQISKAYLRRPRQGLARLSRRPVGGARRAGPYPYYYPYGGDTAAEAATAAVTAETTRLRLGRIPRFRKPANRRNPQEPIPSGGQGEIVGQRSSFCGDGYLFPFGSEPPAKLASVRWNKGRARRRQLRIWASVSSPSPSSPSAWVCYGLLSAGDGKQQGSFSSLKMLRQEKVGNYFPTFSEEPSHSPAPSPFVSMIF